MLSRSAWVLCSRAFEASRRDDISAPMQRLCQRAGVAGYWTALTLEGRAVAVWRDMRAEERRRRSNDEAGHTVAAWSLPPSARMKGLGLGRVWAVACPFCSEFHTHAPGEGPRRAYCTHDAAPRTYVLQHAGEMPRELRERFCSRVRRDLPRFLYKSPRAPWEPPAPFTLPQARRVRGYTFARRLGRGLGVSRRPLISIRTWAWSAHSSLRG